MSEPGQEKPLGGLARSIGALFSESPTAAPSIGAPRPEAPAPPDPEAEHAESVAQLLGEVEHVVPAADSGNGLARRVVTALGRERDEALREALTRACVRLGRPAAEELSAALAETQERAGRRAYLDALVAMGEPAMAVVEAMMEDDRWYVLRNGVSILGEVGGERAMAHVVGALGRPEPKVRREALIALAKIGGGDAGQVAFGMLEDPDPSVRTAAARAVGDLGVERAHKRLVAMLGKDADPELLVAVLHALGQLGDPGAVPAIERHAVGSFLRRPRTDVRIAAYRALRQIGTPRARRLLNQAVDDRDPVVKQSVRHLLGMA